MSCTCEIKQINHQLQSIADNYARASRVGLLKIARRHYLFDHFSANSQQVFACYKLPIQYTCKLESACLHDQLYSLSGCVKFLIMHHSHKN